MGQRSGLWKSVRTLEDQRELSSESQCTDGKEN